MGALDHFPLAQSLPVPQPFSTVEIMLVAVFLVLLGSLSRRRRKESGTGKTPP